MLVYSMTEKLLGNSENRFDDFLLPQNPTIGWVIDALTKRYHTSLDDLTKILEKVGASGSLVAGVSVDTQQELSPTQAREIEDGVRVYHEEMSASYARFEDWVAEHSEHQQLPDYTELWGELVNPGLDVRIKVVARSQITMASRTRWPIMLYYEDSSTGKVVSFAVDQVEPITIHPNLPNAGRSRLYAGDEVLDFIDPGFDGGVIPGRAVLYTSVNEVKPIILNSRKRGV